MNLVKESHWTKNETFFFVNQASTKTKGYPCMTTKDSNDPGRPCSFPFVRDWSDRDVQTYHECTNVDNKDIFCYTKVHENRSFVRNVNKYWGLCSKECHAENFEPSSIFNLAKDGGFEHLWSLNIFDLRHIFF